MATLAGELDATVDPQRTEAQHLFDVRDHVLTLGRHAGEDPFGAGGAYLNFMMEEGEDRIKATYRGNYDRLAAIKAKYDPGNFFRVNQNIRPAA